MGVFNIAHNKEVLEALNPCYAIQFIVDNRGVAFIALGSIVPAFTGAEALYADMGHFGKRPIRVAWFAIAFSALGLSYMGQGATRVHLEFQV